MCGVVGLFNPLARDLTQVPGLISSDLRELSRGMLGLIRHRGPDEMGLLRTPSSFFGSARLSIVDLKTGTQPIRSSSGRYWIVYNGEIYDVAELRAKLQANGMTFSTTSDTEVVVNLYDRYRDKFTQYLNGEFAFAIFDTHLNELRLYRDPFGTKPLYYIELAEGLVLFSSEIKPLLWAASGDSPQLNARAIVHALEAWTPLAPETSFKGIFAIPPGTEARINQSGIRLRRYFTVPRSSSAGTSAEARELLTRAVKRRLVADVPVGVYLSGGIDSSIVAHAACAHSSVQLHTFSVEFDDEGLDESTEQLRLAQAFNTNHHAIRIASSDIVNHFIPALLAAESIVFRSAFVPMYLLSRLVRDRGIKTVLSGEGSDELFGGYDIFKEHLVLRSWAKDPDGVEYLQKICNLYPYLPQFQGPRSRFMAPFYRSFLDKLGAPFFGHMTRWTQFEKNRSLLNPDLRSHFTASPSSIYLSEHYPELASLSDLDQTRLVEMLSLLHGYLLSTQGDRMASAHSVECRIPFLDSEVVQFGFRSPIDRLVPEVDGRFWEKKILYDAFGDVLPDYIIGKKKQPYLAPDSEVFFRLGFDWRSFVNEETLSTSGIFDAPAVIEFFEKVGTLVEQGKPISRRDNTAIFVVLSSMVLRSEIESTLQPVDIEDILRKEEVLGEREIHVSATL